MQRLSVTRIELCQVLSLTLALLLAISLTRPAQAANADAEDQITLPAGRSAVITAPWAVSKVSVAEPKIADVQVVTTDQVVILAKSVGTTDVVLWSEDGQAVRKVVRVEMDVKGLQSDLETYFPSADLKVSQSRDLVTINGTFRRAEDVASMNKYMETTGVKYVDLTSLAGLQQVLIKVRVAEASRQSLRSLGINAFHTGNDFFGGSTIGGNPNSIDIGVEDGVTAGHGLPFTFNSATSVGSGVTTFFGIPEADLQFFLEALEDNQYLRVLSEPSLVALSGEEASFLAGGEFPIPVVQGGTGTGDGSSSITIEFKEFGVRLKFKPVVLGDGTIRLRVAPEVSSLSDEGAVTIEGFQVPSLNTRRAETTLEMKTGQTFALAGLLDQETRARSQSVPGLNNVPILGSLFRSVRYQQADTELVVLATVHLVEPVTITTRRPLPGDLHAAPSDWELYAGGHIESRTPVELGPIGAEWMEDKGLDQLRGPGAWQSYMEPSPEVIPPKPAKKAAKAQREPAPVEEAAPAESTESAEPTEQSAPAEPAK